MPDKPIQAEIIPEKKSLTGKVVEPEKVKISREDYEYLRERAAITNAIKNAWEKLQRFGKQLWVEVDRNARVKAAEARAEKAERQTRQDGITIDKLTKRAEAAEQQTQEQEQFMKRLGIWQRFLEKQRERQEQTRHRTR